MTKGFFKFIRRALFWIFAIIGGSSLTIKWNQSNGPLELHLDSANHEADMNSGSMPHITLTVDDDK